VSLSATQLMSQLYPFSLKYPGWYALNLDMKLTI